MLHRTLDYGFIGMTYTMDDEELHVDGKIILKLILGKEPEKVWTGCILLRIGINSGLP
jgi:hypothetical protein